MDHLIAPSLLSADFSNLIADIKMINQSEADWFHMDIMDGMFVPNISFGIPVIKSVKKHAEKPLDVHLMIVDPDRYLKQFKDAGADLISVHYEACPHLHRTIQMIRSLDARPGVVLNPHTSVSLLDDIIQKVDYVLLMSVNPGFGGQKFIQNTYTKIRQLKEIITHKNADVLIEIDGGVDLKNAPKLIEAGADVLVAGNTIFSSPNPTKTIKQLKQVNIPGDS